MDDLLTELYKQRDDAVTYLVKRRGVPCTDAEILVDKTIEAAIKAQKRGRRTKSSLVWQVGPWLEAYRRHPEMVTWDETVLPKRGRKEPAPRAD